MALLKSDPVSLFLFPFSVMECLMLTTCYLFASLSHSQLENIAEQVSEQGMRKGLYQKVIDFSIGIRWLD